MSYCQPHWLSDYTYVHLWARLHVESLLSSAWLAQAPTEEVLAVFGMANVTQGTAELFPFYRLQDMVIEDPIPSDDWALVLYGAGDAELARHPFTPKEDSQAEEGEEVAGLIQELIPWVEGTTRIAVLYRDGAAAARAVSAHAPVVTLLSPNGGELWEGDEVVVRWLGTDADGDALTYALQYSADAGTTWTAVAVGLSGDETTLPLAHIPGSDNALLRIIASDGVLTGQDTSDATFRVAGKAPEAYIISPAAGHSYTADQQVVLVGEGYDVEDGILDDPSLSWHSDLAGDLGTGTHLSVLGLGKGVHVITLTATDSELNSAKTSVTIYVDMPLRQITLPLVLKA
ncbi:MAG: hypothetical protein FJZ90_06645 [Chloroflexi bacterium]|nr:hypothetical protein [Chloroflexota bacterium]